MSILSIPFCIAHWHTQSMHTWYTRAKDRLKQIERTQDWLADQFGMTPGGMQKWLSGSREPSLDSIIRIAGLLRCSPAWLLLGMAEDEQINGLPESAQSALRHLIRAERAGPLPPAFWQGLELMAPAAALPTLNDQPSGGAQSPTDCPAPRNGTHG